MELHGDELRGHLALSAPRRIQARLAPAAPGRDEPWCPSPCSSTVAATLLVTEGGVVLDASALSCLFFRANRVRNGSRRSWPASRIARRSERACSPIVGASSAAARITTRTSCCSSFRRLEVIIGVGRRRR